MPLPPRLSQTRVVKKLDPDQPGAKKLALRFGADLVCVRYRQDRPAGQRYTTVELVVDAGPIANDNRLPATVQVRIGHSDRDLRQALIRQGAEWNPDKQVWSLDREAVKRLKIYNRITRK